MVPGLGPRTGGCGAELGGVLPDQEQRRQGPREARGGAPGRRAEDAPHRLRPGGGRVGGCGRLKASPRRRHEQGGAARGHRSEQRHGCALEGWLSGENPCVVCRAGGASGRGVGSRGARSGSGGFRTSGSRTGRLRSPGHGGEEGSPGGSVRAAGGFPQSETRWNSGSSPGGEGAWASVQEGTGGHRQGHGRRQGLCRGQGQGEGRWERLGSPDH